MIGMVSNHEEPAALARLVAENRIHAVLHAYCQGVDRKDWAQVRQCYHDDARDSHGPFLGTPDELLSWLSNRHEYVSSSMHVLTNISVRLSDDGRLARVESYCLSFQQVDPGGDDPFAGSPRDTVRTTIACRYVDTFESRPGTGWRIQTRDVAFDWMRRETKENYIPLDPAWTSSRRDQTDLLYAPLLQR
jgi:hypothetical protein